MPVIHALHSVLVGLFVVTNLLLIPIAAMFGAALGSIFFRGRSSLMLCWLHGVVGNNGSLICALSLMKSGRTTVFSPSFRSLPGRASCLGVDVCGPDDENYPSVLMQDNESIQAWQTKLDIG